MTTKPRTTTSSEKTADDKVADAIRDERDDANREPTEAERKESEKEAEEAREEANERAAAVAAPSGEAAIPVDDNAISQPPVPTASTHVDKDGVERITSGTDIDGWTPAPVDPHPSQVEAAEKRNAAIDKQREETMEASRKASRVSEDRSDKDTSKTSGGGTKDKDKS